MPFASNQTPANSQLPSHADSSTPRPLDVVSSSFDRSIIGIPAEDDDFTRGLTFFFDPSTGQPSVPSTSEDSDNPGETSPFEASSSSNNASSCRVLTPKSVSDASGGLHPRIFSSRSIGSSEGGSSDGGADRSHNSSVSARASSGGSQAVFSPTSIQTPSHLPIAKDHMATPISPAVDPPTSEHWGLSGDMSDLRAIFPVEPNDVRYLEKIMDPSRSGDQAQALDPIDLVDNQVSRSIAPPHPDMTQGARTEHEKRNPSTRSRTEVVAIRAQRVSEPGSNRTRRRPHTKDAIESARTADKKKLMRQIGACLPCLVNHEECDFEKICSKCSNPKIPKTPCIRPHLSQAILFRKGALSFPEGPPQIKNWVSGRNVTILLYNIGPADPSVSPESRPWLRVRCREFPFTPGIRSSKSWTKGKYKIDIHFPNFAMTKCQYSEAGRSLDALVKAEYDKLVRELATGQEDIISETLKEAVRQAERCWLIKGALQLSILSRLASKSFNLFGQETLGIQQEQDPDCPYYNRIPIPPLLDAQIDFLLMDKMKGLGKTVLAGLRKLIAGQGRKHWFEIFLTISVLLFNLESVYQNQCRQIKRYEERTQQQRVLLQSWEDSAQSLIEHFRAVCRGHIPLNMEWSKADQGAAEVDGQSQEFINRLISTAESRAEELRQRSRASCDTPLVWISALFAPQEGV